QVDGSAFGGAVALTNGTASLSLSALAAGQHSVRAVYNPDSSDFTSSTSSGLNQSVAPALLTITPDNESKVYAAAVPALTVTYSGFVNGDTAASLSTAPTLSTTATAASHVGHYSITASGAVDADYTISYASGTLTVTPALLTITTNDQSKVYG